MTLPMGGAVYSVHGYMDYTHNCKQEASYILLLVNSCFGCGPHVDNYR